MKSPTFTLAGESARFRGRYEEATAFHRSAEQFALDDRDRRRALWPQLLVAVALEQTDADDLLARFLQVTGDKPDDLLQAAVARWAHGLRMGSIAGVLEHFTDASHTLNLAADPMIVSSFLYSYTNALCLHGHYHEALVMADRTRRLAKDRGITFIEPLLIITRSLVLIGLRRSRVAASALDNLLARADRVLPQALLTRGLPKRAFC